MLFNVTAIKKFKNDYAILRCKRFEGFRLDNDVLAICPNAAATPLLSLDKYNRFTKNC